MLSVELDGGCGIGWFRSQWCRIRWFRSHGVELVCGVS